MTEKQTVWCDGCGRQLDESPSTRDEERIACPDCGSQARKVDVGVASGVEVTDVAKAKARSGEAGKPGGRPWLELSSGASWSTKYKKWMQRLKVVDRRHDRYTEKVVDPHTGKIIHECEEPLREHRDHGSARPRD